MSEEMVLVIAFIIGSILVTTLILIIVKYNKKHMKRILETISPIWVKFIDVLVIQISTGDDNMTVYLPVFQNTRDNKVYIPSTNGNYGYLYPTVEGLFSNNPQIVSKNIKKEKVEFNKEGRLYIEKENGNVVVEDNKVTIQSLKTSYSGKYQKTVKLGCMYNIHNDNILELINNATIYSGIVDFDIEGILREHLN